MGYYYKNDEYDLAGQVIGFVIVLAVIATLAIFFVAAAVAVAAVVGPFVIAYMILSGNLAKAEIAASDDIHYAKIRDEVLGGKGCWKCLAEVTPGATVCSSCRAELKSEKEYKTLEMRYEGTTMSGEEMLARAKRYLRIFWLIVLVVISTLGVVIYHLYNQGLLWVYTQSIFDRMMETFLSFLS